MVYFNVINAIIKYLFSLQSHLINQADEEYNSFPDNENRHALDRTERLHIAGSKDAHSLEQIIWKYLNSYYVASHSPA